MIPDDETKKRIQSLPKRHWIYLDGKTNPEIEIPEYKKEGTVTYLRPKIAEQPQKLNLFKDSLNGTPEKRIETQKLRATKTYPKFTNAIKRRRQRITRRRLFRP